MLSLFSPGTFLLFFFSAHSNFSPLSVLLCWKVVCLHSFEHLFFFFEYSHIIEEQRRNANEEEGEECFFFSLSALPSVHLPVCFFPVLSLLRLSACSRCASWVVVRVSRQLQSKFSRNVRGLCVLSREGELPLFLSFFRFWPSIRSLSRNGLFDAEFSRSPITTIVIVCC